MDPLKQYLVEQKWIASDATDEQVNEVAADKLKAGELTRAKYAELATAQPAADEKAAKAAEFADNIATKVSGAVGEQLKGLGDTIVSGITTALGKQQAPPATEGNNGSEGKDATPEHKAHKPNEGNGDSLPTTRQALAAGADGGEGSGGDDVRVRVKKAVEGYDYSPTAATYKHGFKKGEPIRYNGKPLHQPTQLREKLCSVYAKSQGAASVREWRLNEHDARVLEYIAFEEPFVCLDYQSTDSRKMRDDEARRWLGRIARKTGSQHLFKADLLDDSTSGGEDAVPEFFDQEIILTPLLTSQVGGFVDVRDVARGSSARRLLMDNVSIGARTEGTAVTVFDATAFMQRDDVPFFEAAGFIKVGRNFLADALPQTADEIRQSFNRVALVWIDEQITNGDGTTEPEGVFQAAGTIDIAAANGVAGEVTFADSINLIFGVPREFRQMYPQSTWTFIMNDEVYQDFRKLATGVTGDERLIFGPDILDYMLHNVNVATPSVVPGSSDGIGNNQAGFLVGGGYTLYRRQGARPIFEDRGDTLVRENTVLMGIDQRYGGALKRGSYFAKTDDFGSDATTTTSA